MRDPGPNCELILEKGPMVSVGSGDWLALFCVLLLEVNNRHDTKLRSRVAVDDAIGRLVHFLQGLFRVLMDGVSLRGSCSGLLHTLNDAGDHPRSVVF